ncbi:MAG: TetR/AcrR family transcriptional regulator [Proteobacteria bacterium]|nr:TetR/AcrR family transcriptional regulator [Pseudomonadota bacterium]
MDNISRSERTRKLVLEAALAVISRDGPNRLTLEAIAKEAGVSKGGLLHQFPNKIAVMRALLERQVAFFNDVRDKYIAEAKENSAYPELAAHIATLRETSLQPHSIAVAFLGALIEDPQLLRVSRDTDSARNDGIRAEANDPDLAMLRKFAANGLALSHIFGLSETSKEESMRLFDRLLDDSQWVRSEKAPAIPKAKPLAKNNKPTKRRES